MICFIMLHIGYYFTRCLSLICYVRYLAIGLHYKIIRSRRLEQFNARHFDARMTGIQARKICGSSGQLSGHLKQFVAIVVCNSVNIVRLQKR